MPIGTFIVVSLAAYAVAGLAFGLFFVTRAVGRVDPAAQGASVAFRLLILPGVAALWPVMLAKWVGHVRRKELS